STIDLVGQSGRSDELIFINAWNEWAEGCHLEPDRWFGHGFLQATLNAKSGMRRFLTPPETSVPHEAGSTRQTFWKDIGRVVQWHIGIRFGGLKLAINRWPWLRAGLIPFVKAVNVFRAKARQLMQRDQ
ncbi:MAG TPA: glycoside hydrolase family 99-like domain-containing protein, partial [Nitrospira sp.]|nr:glycoside hydrolase family 99-like domain-containing protein [Nitrospira sp.]